jgi:hypothetical protein
MINRVDEEITTLFDIFLFSIIIYNEETPIPIFHSVCPYHGDK